MDENVEQYRKASKEHLRSIDTNSRIGLSQDGLGAYQSYLLSLTGNPHQFSSSHLNSIVNSFAPTLCKHQGDEIQTPLSLFCLGSTLPIAEIWAIEGPKAAVDMDKTGSRCCSSSA